MLAYLISICTKVGTTSVNFMLCSCHNLCLTRIITLTHNCHATPTVHPRHVLCTSHHFYFFRFLLFFVTFVYSSLSQFNFCFLFLKIILYSNCNWFLFFINIFDMNFVVFILLFYIFFEINMQTIILSLYYLIILLEVIYFIFKIYVFLVYIYSQ